MKITSLSHLGASKEGDDWSTWKAMNHRMTGRLGRNLAACFHGDIYERVGDVTNGFIDDNSTS
jgi:hypothetical protein